METQSVYACMVGVERLNRTMQYGNKAGYEFECADIPV